MKRFAADPLVTGLAVLLAAFCAVMVASMLSAFARPAGLAGRFAAVEAQADWAQAIIGARGDPYAYPKGALCGGAVETAAAAFRQRVQAAAGGANLGQPTVQAVARRLDFDHGAPSVEIQVSASGRYDSVVAMLNSLAASQPIIIVDTLDLQPRVSVVDLKLTGHLLCRPPARS